MSIPQGAAVSNVVRRFVNSTRQKLVFVWRLWKDLCAAVGAPLPVPGHHHHHHHHLEGCSVETAGSCPQGEERGRQARECEDIS